MQTKEAFSLVFVACIVLFLQFRLVRALDRSFDRSLDESFNFHQVSSNPKYDIRQICFSSDLISDPSSVIPESFCPEHPNLTFKQDDGSGNIAYLASQLKRHQVEHHDINAINYAFGIHPLPFTDQKRDFLDIFPKNYTSKLPFLLAKYTSPVTELLEKSGFYYGVFLHSIRSTTHSTDSNNPLENINQKYPPTENNSFEHVIYAEDLEWYPVTSYSILNPTSLPTQLYRLEAKNKSVFIDFFLSGGTFQSNDIWVTPMSAYVRIRAKLFIDRGSTQTMSFVVCGGKERKIHGYEDGKKFLAYKDKISIKDKWLKEIYGKRETFTAYFDWSERMYVEGTMGHESVLINSFTPDKRKAKTKKPRRKCSTIELGSSPYMTTFPGEKTLEWGFALGIGDVPPIVEGWKLKSLFFISCVLFIAIGILVGIWFFCNVWQRSTSDGEQSLGKLKGYNSIPGHHFPDPTTSGINIRSTPGSIGVPSLLKTRRSEGV